MLFNQVSKPIKWAIPLKTIAFVESPKYSLIQAIETYGLPFVEGATPDEELATFLKAAAEVEHGLMIQYLYASSSCANDTITGIIREIAMEEMGHLVTVQNLLAAIGEPPYLGRYDRSGGTFAPFEFSLQPVSRESVAKYTVCERPEDKLIPADIQPIFPAILSDAKASAGGPEPQMVGLLYAKIYWLLRETDQPLADPSLEEWSGFPITEIATYFPPNTHATQYPKVKQPLQAAHNDWYGSNNALLILPAATRGDARKAIAAIASQGEGFGNQPDGHFERFVAAYRVAVGAGNIARNYPTNPWFRFNGAKIIRVKGDEITLDTAIDFARLADMLYEILLNHIALALHAEITDPIQRSSLAGYCIKMMRKGISRLIKGTDQLGITSDASSPKFAPCYTLPVGSAAIADIQQRISVLLPTAKTLCAKLQQLADIIMSGAADDIFDCLNSAPSTNVV